MLLLHYEGPEDWGGQWDDLPRKDNGQPNALTCRKAIRTCARPAAVSAVDPIPAWFLWGHNL